MTDLINEGDHVVLMKSFDSGNMKIVQVQKERVVHYGKLHFDPSPLAGARYGNVFEIKEGKMTKVDNFEKYDSELSELMSSKMSTFNEKNQFSQEKILKKKKKKIYSNVVTAIKPNLLLVNEMLFAREKIGGLRADILAQVITLSNMQNGYKCLILDHNLGMITSAVMSRILPDGVCIQLLQDYEVIQTTRKTMNMLNIKEDNCIKNLCSITIRDMYKVYKSIDSFVYEGEILELRNRAHLDRLAQMQGDQKCEVSKKPKFDSECDPPNKTIASTEQLQQTLLKKEINRELRQRERVEAAIHLKDRSLDTIIIVVQNDHPLPVLKMMYHFLAHSRQFVIYSDTVGPLLDCHQYLKTNSLAVSLNISESMLRRYQVLPDRTRPEMNASGYGGYLLSGTKAFFSSTIES